MFIKFAASTAQQVLIKRYLFALVLAKVESETLYPFLDIMQVVVKCFPPIN